MTFEAPTRKTQAGAGGVPVFYTPAEIAQILKVDPSTARRLFMDEAGVFKMGNCGRRKREYTTIRIPEAVFQRVLRERSR